MDKMYEMIELTDAELDAVAAGQNIGVQNNDYAANYSLQVGIGEIEELNLNLYL